VGVAGRTRTDLSLAGASASPWTGVPSTGAGGGRIEDMMAAAAGDLPEATTGDPPDLQASGAGDALDGGAAHPAPGSASSAPSKALEVVGEAASISSMPSLSP